MVLRPSQWINIGWIIFGIAGIMWIIPPVIALYKILELNCWTYSIDNEFITEKKGVFSVDHRELQICRIKSMRFEEPFLMRLVGIGNLYVKSSEPYHPELKMWGIPKGSALWNELRRRTGNQRKRNGVKEYDLYNL
jgi:uncharacterized membrane protein YdbT with pleckstrin-like domain